GCGAAGATGWRWQARWWRPGSRAGPTRPVRRRGPLAHRGPPGSGAWVTGVGLGLGVGAGCGDGEVRADVWRPDAVGPGRAGGRVVRGTGVAGTGTAAGAAGVGLPSTVALPSGRITRKPGAPLGTMPSLAAAAASVSGASFAASWERNCSTSSARPAFAAVTS